MSPTPRERWAASANHLQQISGRTAFLLIVVIGFVAHVLQWALLPFIIAALLAYLCTVPVEWLASRTRVRRPLLAIAAFLVVVTAIGIAVSLAAPPLVHGLPSIADHIRRLVGTLVRAAIGTSNVNLTGRSMNAEDLAQSAVKGLGDWLGRTTVIAEVGGWAFTGLFGLPLTLVLFLYFLLDGLRIARGLRWLVPPKERPVVDRIWRRLDPVLKRYFIGVVAVVAYASTAAYVGLGLFLHAPHPLFLAFMTGVLELIPVVGPIAAAVIAGLITVERATGIGPILAYALYATALRLSIDQFFGPLVLGAVARLHPTLIMFCFLVGATLYGVAGVLLAVPVALAVKTALLVLYDDPAAPDAR